MREKRAPICTMPGCGKPHAARGYCQTHYRRVLAHGDANIRLSPPGRYKHGARRKNVPTREYTTWNCMRNRCRNPNDGAYRWYGGRGIKVCDRWDSFENFLTDMGPRPHGCSLDRIDVDADYGPDNCRWLPDALQNRNKRNNRLLTFNGETKTVAEWAELRGLSRDLIGSRINRRGWPVERALTTPRHQQTHRGAA